MRLSLFDGRRRRRIARVRGWRPRSIPSTLPAEGRRCRRRRRETTLLQVGLFGRERIVVLVSGGRRDARSHSRIDATTVGGGGGGEGTMRVAGRGRTRVDSGHRWTAGDGWSGGARGVGRVRGADARPSRGPPVPGRSWHSSTGSLESSQQHGEDVPTRTKGRMLALRGRANRRGSANNRSRPGELPATSHRLRSRSPSATGPSGILHGRSHSQANLSAQGQRPSGHRATNERCEQEGGRTGRIARTADREWTSAYAPMPSVVGQ